MEVRFMISNAFPFRNGWFSGSILIFGGVSIRTSQNSTGKDVNVKCRMSFPTAVGSPEENNRCLSSSFCRFNDLANSFITHRIHVWYIDGVGNKLQNWCVCGVFLKPSPPWYYVKTHLALADTEYCKYPYFIPMWFQPSQAILQRNLIDERSMDLSLS